MAWLSRLLFRFTATRPCRLIKIGGRPYLERYWLGRWLGRDHYLHRFVGAIPDEGLHDHPWRHSLALVLSGGYTERRLLRLCPRRGVVTRERRLAVGGLNRLREGDFHQIVSVRVETWTWFSHSIGSEVDWGFLRCEPDAPGRWRVIYAQPLDTGADVDWQRRAAIGREAGREPLLV